MTETAGGIRPDVALEVARLLGARAGQPQGFTFPVWNPLLVRLGSPADGQAAVVQGGESLAAGSWASKQYVAELDNSRVVVGTDSYTGQKFSHRRWEPVTLGPLWWIAVKDFDGTTFASAWSSDPASQLAKLATSVTTVSATQAAARLQAAMEEFRSL